MDNPAMETILVADDDLALCKSLTDSLKDEGFSVDFVQNGVEVLNYLENNDVNLLILDLKMPIMDGWQVLKELSTRKYKTKVIVVTAYSDMRSAIDAINLGAINFISKPYDIEEIFITLRGILS